MVQHRPEQLRSARRLCLVFLSAFTSAAIGAVYFVGVLAPRKRARADAAAGVAPAVPPSSGDDDAAETDGEPLDGDELALGGRDTSQDGTTDQTPAQDKALIPSSFGMTFSVNKEANAIEVAAAWGQYQ